MVAVVAGAGLGLERSSALVLGGAGLLGQARLGRGGDNVYVNAANGNLVVQNTDDMLFGLGPDSTITRTHNSLTTSGSSWQQNVTRRVTGLTGTLDQTGSTIKRISWDGSDVTYTWNGSAYVGKEGAGGYDTLTLSGSTWTWTDGASRLTETYDNANGGRILTSSDVDGNKLTYTYNGSGQLTRVATQDATANAGYTDLVYTGTLLTSIVTKYRENGVDKTMTRVSYGYDTSNRLTTVTVDLTPTNTSDSKTYVTTYGYDGTSSRVASITQSDGSSLLIEYTQVVAGDYRVTKLTELAASGTNRVTNISYNLASRVTTVTDPLGQATQLAYDTAGQLLSVTSPPPVSGGAALVTSFTYNSMGDVLEATAPNGSKVTYTYDASGRLTKEVDGAGNTVTRTFGSKNELLTETRYLVAAQGATAASVPLTTRYSYDVENHLRFVVGAEGDVTEYRYDAAGLQTSVIRYSKNTYNIGALTPTDTISESALVTWVGTADKAATKRTDTTYDFRGNISTVTAFEKTLSDGSGDTAGQKSQTVYIYDHTGRLVSRQPLTAGQAEVMVYDGLGRLISTTDFAGRSTSIVFNDATNTTVVTLVNGVTQTSTYNKAGDLVSYAEAGSGVSTATTNYKYDSAGRLRVLTDASGQATHHLYDDVGRRIAEILPDGTITEFKYNANDQLIATVQYARKLTTTQLNGLLVGGVPANVTLASVRPTSDTADRWQWRIYDQADRLVETIDGTGGATVYAYDGASRVTSTTSYARLFDSTALTGFKTTPPTTIQIPGGSSTTQTFLATYAANAGPTAAGDSVSVTKDTPVTFNPQANDADPDGDPLTITAVSVPTHGTATVTANGLITYTPTAGYTGPDSFTYTVSDGRGGTATATVTITVATPANGLPTASNDQVNTTQGAPVTFNPRANDVDPDGDALTITAVSPPAHGTASINPDGTITYTPAAGYAGPDAFTYTVSDGRGGMASASVVVNVSAASNYAPTAANDMVSTAQGVAVIINPQFNDSDADGDVLSIQSVGTPSRGRVTINDNGTLTYTPNAGFAGIDSFTYAISDGRGGTASATVQVTVTASTNSGPVAANDDVSTSAGTSVTFNPRRNDHDPDGDGLTITTVGSAGHGTVVINSGGSITYNPTGGYTGPDSFTYTVSDGRGGTATAQVNITVYSANEFTGLATPSVIQWDDGGTGVDFASSVDSNYQGEGFPAFVVQKSHPPAWTPTYDGSNTYAGSIALQAAGSGGDAWDVTPGERIGVAFEAKGLGATSFLKVSVHYWNASWGDLGDSATFEVPVSDWARIETDALTVPAGARYAAIVVEVIGEGDQRSAASFGAAIRKPQFVRLSENQAMPGWPVTTLANTDPTVVNDLVTTTTGAAITFNPRTNDSDVDRDGLTITAVGTPAHGTATINVDGTITYIPTGGYTGTDTFTYTVSDGRGGTTTGSVTVSIALATSASNAPPVAANDSVSTSKGVAVTFNPRGNDVDVDGDALSIISVSTPSNGAAVVNADRSITYTPAAGYTGPDSFTYTISDGRGGIATATVDVTVQAPANTAPIANNDAIHTNDGVPITFNPRVNDSDADNDGLIITAVGSAAHGTVTLNGGYTLTYTPTPGYKGADSFAYTISDGRGGITTGTVNVTVYGANEFTALVPEAVATWLPRGTGVDYSATAQSDYQGSGFDALVLTKSQPMPGVPAYANSITRPGSFSLWGVQADDEFRVTGGERLGFAFEAQALGAVTHVEVMIDFYDNSWGDLPNSTVIRVPVSPSGWVRIEDVITAPAGAKFAAIVIEPTADGDQRTAALFGVALRKPQFLHLSSGQAMQAWPASAATNTAPVVANDLVTTPQGSAVTFNPRLNDADADMDPLSVAATSTPAHGSVSINGDGSITYTPAPGYTGPDSFTYTLSDGRGGTATATVNVTVSGAGGTNTAPVAAGDTVTTSKGTQVVFNPRINDADPDGDLLSVTAVGAPAYGTASINGDGNIVYTPAPGYTGPDSFTYTISDGRGGTATATVNVTVQAPANTAPIANNDAIHTNDGVPITFNPRVNDSDADNDGLIITAVGSAAHGTVTLNGGYTLTYTPTPGYIGADSFAYTISDGRGGITTGTVNVTVYGANEFTALNAVATWFDRGTGVDYSTTAQSDYQGSGFDALVLTKSQPMPGVPAYANSITRPGSFGVWGAGDGGEFIVTGGERLGFAFEAQALGAVTHVEVMIHYWSNSWGDLPNSTVIRVPVSPSGWVRIEDVITAPAGAKYAAIVIEPTADGDQRTAALFGVALRKPQFLHLSSGQAMQAWPASAATNTAPVVANDLVTTPQGSAVTFNPRLNDADADMDPLSVAATSTPAHGSVSINGDGSITYTPAPGYTGPDSFTYTLSDGRGGTATATVNVTVSGAGGTNTAPVANNDAIHTNDGVPITFNPRVNDSDADNDGLIITAVGSAAHGTVTLNDGYTLTYTPTPGYKGADSFAYTISDGRGGITTGTVNVTVYGANEFTALVPEAVATWLDRGTRADYSATAQSDYQGSGFDALVLTKSQPMPGVPAYANSITRPGSFSLWGVEADDEFRVTGGERLGFAFEAQALGAVTHVEVMIDFWSNSWGDLPNSTVIRVPVSPSGWVRIEDVITAPAGAKFAAIVIEPTADGDQRTAALFGVALRKPQFLHLSSGQAMQAWPASAATNTAPVVANDLVTTPQGSAVTFNPRLNDADADMDPLSVAATSTPAHGSVSINGDGSITYTPAPGYTGPDSFTYTLSDGRGGTATATVNVTVSGAGGTNTAPVAAGDTVTTSKGTQVVFNPRINDADPDGDLLSVTAVGAPAYGTASINGDGNIVYTPAPGYTGPDSFTYTISDGRGGTATATVNVTVQAPANTAPVAAGDTVTTSKGTQVVFNPRVNDADPDGDLLSVTAVGAPAYGTASINGDGNIVYTPAAGYTGPDSFTYTISDGRGGTATATVNVTVQAPANTAPVAAGDTVTTSKGTQVVFNPRVNDADPDGDPLTIVAVDVPSHGTASISGDGNIVYTPAAGYTGPDSFTYTISDGRGGTATATVNVTVDAPANTDPFANNDAITTLAGSAITYNPRSNDADADGDPLTLIAVGTPTHGSAVIENGAVVYTPGPGYSGPDSFTYTISDGRGGTATATINVTVQAIPAVSDDDRIVRNFYDGNGRLVGVLDGEGYLTQTRYDAAGQAIETITFANAAGGTARTSGTLSEVIANVGVSPSDVHAWSLYDGRGFVRATINGEGDLTRYSYTASGEVSVVTVGQKLDVTALLATAPTLAGLPAAPGGAVLETVTYNRDAFGLVTSEVKSLTGGGSETTTYVYDNMRRLVTTTKASGTADARLYNQVYDLRGRLIRALNGEGSAALAALGGSPNQAQIDSVYQSYGVIYTYDDADRLTSKREPSGVGAGGVTTLYYYDSVGRLTYEVNGAGEVRQYVYNTFGERADIVLYGTRIASGVLATLVTAGGGAITTTLTNAITASALVDSKTHYDYDNSGRVSQRIDPLSMASTYAYNAFGELVSQLDPIASGVNVQTNRTFDRRGLLLTETADAAVGGLQLKTERRYDAFGRLLQVIDANGQTRSRSYDRAGRTVSTTDALGKTAAYTYDGRGAVLTQTDRTGRTTQFEYTAFNRQVKVTTPEGVVTTTQSNAHGETISITVAVAGGSSRTTAWTYDKDGQVKTVKQAVGTADETTITSTYDSAGHLYQVTDGRGSKTTYTYDAAHRVLTRKVDDGGLNLLTSYAYDAKGQQVSVTDPSGTLTQTTFDLAGRQTLVTVDHGAGRLALATAYTYDAAGRVLTVTEANGTAAQKLSKYNYDKAGRLTSTQVDPNGLNLTTSFTYDKAGNAVSRTDANNKTTRFVYDGEGRQIYAVDPMGAVTAATYDAEGRIASTRQYASFLSASAPTGLNLSAAQVSANISVAQSDQLTSYVYDGDGRLRFVVQPDQRLTEYVYDGSGNRVRTVEYGGTVAILATYTVAGLTSEVASKSLASHAQTRVSREVYDNANRLAYFIDAAGTVTAFSYDANGNAVKSIRYGQAYSTTTTPTAAQMASWVSGLSGSVARRTDRTLFDAANRAVFQVDALNYVTERQYDAAGRVTKLIRHANTQSVTDTTTASALKTAIGAPTSTAQVTTYTFDTAGRLTDVTDALGVVTHMVLDAMGRVVDTTAAYGLAEASTTRNAYDAAGRLTSQTRAFGASEATTTAYTYDGVGRVLTKTDASGTSDARRTTYAYDAAGHLASSRVDDAGLNLTTSYTYDAFGNVSSIVDPRGSRGYFYYDKLNRQVLSVDPEGYATATAYSIGGQAVSITRYGRATTGASLGAPPTLAPHAKDATTLLGRDKLDRLTSVTDAEGYAETYELNAFGDQIAVTNRLGGRTTKIYDALGRMTSETLPITSSNVNGTITAYSVINTYAYDARGNLLTQVEASGLAESRTTTFEYDLLDRRTKKTGEAVPVLSQADGNTVTNQTPVETTKYDARGNIIEAKDARGARTLFYYDRLDRKVWQVNPISNQPDLSVTATISEWQYDRAGNVVAQRDYGDLITLPTTAGGTPPSPINASNRRETTYAYDKANRLVQTTTPGLRTGYWNGEVYVTSVAAVTNQTEYDAAGNVVRQTDGRGASIYIYYDRRGKKIAQVDQNQYLTTYTLDAEGNVLTETRYATRVATWVTTSSDPASLAAGVAGASADDRITDFVYDRNGRRVTETRRNVEAYAVSGAAVYGGKVGATITYSYNGLGQVTSRSEATGDTWTYAYDGMGRLVRELAPTIINHNGFARTRQTQNFYDGLGNLTRVYVGAKELVQVATDQVTQYTYGKGGRLLSVKDAESFVRNFEYDLLGQVLRVSYDRKNSSGTTTKEGVLYGYDLAGRVFVQASMTYGAAAWTWTDPLRMRYDAYGAVVAQGVGGDPAQLPTYYDYDAAGRLWRTNAGDGVDKIYVYDAAGNRTMTITSSGEANSDVAAVNWNLKTRYSSVEEVMAVLTESGAKSVGEVWIPQLTVTLEVYDGRNQVTETRALARRTSWEGGWSLIRQTRDYNAFGEVARETNALGGVVQYTYTTLGQVRTRQDVGMGYTDASGATYSQSPEQTFYYDASGRQVGYMNQRSRMTTWDLLAGYGYGGEATRYTAEHKLGMADKKMGYDAFGNVKVYTDENGMRERWNYDRMNRVSEAYRETRNEGTADQTTIRENYTYDGLDQRLSRTVYLQSGYDGNFTFVIGVEKTDYDAAGRVRQTVDSTGLTETYSYVFEEGEQSGWIQTRTTGYGKYTEERTDQFGRTLWREDEEDRRYTMTYDNAGRMVLQTSNGGQHITYQYYNTGKIRAIIDQTAVLFTAFGYDADGNQTRERFAVNGIDHRQATASYDTFGRRLTYDDIAVDGRRLKIAYAYTSMNDVRRVTVQHEGGGVGYSQKDLWYHYDDQNRLIISGGQLSSGGQIVLGAEGVGITYQGTRRASTTRNSVNGLRVETYTYTKDGYLQETQITDGGILIYRATDHRDGLGRVWLHKELNGSNVEIFGRDTTNYIGLTDRYETDVTRTRQSNGAVIQATTTNSYNYGRLTWASTAYSVLSGSATAPSGYTTVYNYTNWDGTQLASITSTGATTAVTTYNYDVNRAVSTINITGEKARNVSFITDSMGQVISRKEFAQPSGTAGPSDFFHYFTGVLVGQNGNNGPGEFDYYTSIQQRAATASPNLFRNGAPTPYAGVADGYDPINPTSQGEAQAASSFRVREGDTLRSIALAIWGDESLWYVIAEANGLTANAQLVANQILTIPNKVVNAQYKSSTFKVVDQGQVLGDIQPQQPSPTEPVNQASKKKGCGAIGKILMVIVAVVVTVVTAAAATAAIATLQGVAGVTTTGVLAGTATTGISAGAFIAGGAIGGAAGSIASQGVGIAMGVQDKFSWKGVALSAIAGGVGGAMKEVAFLSKIGGEGTLGTMVRSATGNAITQGVAMATGLQSRFDWTSVAISAVAGGVAEMIGNTSFVKSIANNAPALSVRGLAAAGVSNTAGAIAGSAMRSLVEGSDFGDNLMSALPDVIGSTVGNMIAGGIQQRAADAAAARARGDQMLADVRRTMAGAQEAIDNIGRRTPLSLYGDDYASSLGSTIGGGSAGSYGFLQGGSGGDYLRGGGGGYGSLVGNPDWASPGSSLTTLGQVGQSDYDEFIQFGTNPSVTEGGVTTVAEVSVTAVRRGTLGWLKEAGSDLIHGRFGEIGGDLSAAGRSFARTFMATDAAQNYGRAFNMPVTPASSSRRQEQAASSSYISNVVAPETNRQLAIGGAAIIGTGVTLGAAPAASLWLGATAQTALPGSIGAATFGTELFGGAVTGVGIGAGVPVVGAGTIAAKGFVPRAFKAGEDIIHFEKHGPEMASVLNLKNYSVAQYVDDANWVIRNGTYAPELSAFVSVPGGTGSAKGLMVGVDRVTGEITTMHLKPVSFFEKRAPSLGWQAQPRSVRTDTIGPNPSQGWVSPY